MATGGLRRCCPLGRLPEARGSNPRAADRSGGMCRIRCCVWGWGSLLAVRSGPPFPPSRLWLAGRVPVSHGAPTPA